MQLSTKMGATSRIKLTGFTVAEGLELDLGVVGAGLAVVGAAFVLGVGADDVAAFPLVWSAGNFGASLFEAVGVGDAGFFLASPFPSSAWAGKNAEAISPIETIQWPTRVNVLRE